MFAELLASPGVEERVALRARVGFLALHGGLEGGTAEIAEAAASRAAASCYVVVQPADLAWHVPSHHFDPGASPRLQQVLAHCDVVVSLHGYGRAGWWTSLLLGGADRNLASRLAAALRSGLPAYDVVDDVDVIPAALRGLDHRNPVNRANGGGVQVELPPRVRGMGPHWDHFDGAGFTPHTEALVDALAGFAASTNARS
ncbi:MAG: poly-gamma-glutamate hydrolase family protein [Acidimicrobiia bacterium]